MLTLPIIHIYVRSTCIHFQSSGKKGQPELLLLAKLDWTGLNRAGPVMGMEDGGEAKCESSERDRKSRQASERYDEEKEEKHPTKRTKWRRAEIERSSIHKYALWRRRSEAERKCKLILESFFVLTRPASKRNTLIMNLHHLFIHYLYIAMVVYYRF